MFAKQGFDWKKIEEKPENWETIRELVKDGYTPRSDKKDKYWDNEDVLEILLEIYPDMKFWIPERHVATNTIKKQKKVVEKKSDKIIQRQTIEIIRNDIKKIRFDPINQMVMKTNYTMEVTTVIMVLVWNYTFYLRRTKSKTINNVAMLDAIISLNRIYEDESMNFNERLSVTVANAITTMNKFVDESMYDTLFNYPYLLIQSTADKRSRKVRLYDEQHQVLNSITAAIRGNKPILLGNQMPTGTGKTMLSVPLAQKVNHMKLNKTLLFACSNELVNQDVACTALLADDLHLWLARLIRDEHNKVMVKIRPYKRCFPATWKKVYKQNDKKKDGTIEEQWEFYTGATNRIPDMIIADLEACHEILKVADNLVDVTKKNKYANPFYAYIDEFISDDKSNVLMKQIARLLPKQSVIISAILPQFHHIHHFVRHFCDRFETTPQEVVKRVDTAVVNISCAVIDPNGCICMPHHEVKTEEDLDLLLRDIKINPRIRRTYTAKHVYHWCKTIQEHLTPANLHFEVIFPNIGLIRNSKILDHAITILEFLRSNFHLLAAFQSYRPKVMDAPSFTDTFTTQAYMYEGKTLMISKSVYDKILTDAFSREGGLFHSAQISWDDLVQDAVRRETEKEHAYKEALKTKCQKGNVMKEDGTTCNKSHRIEGRDMAMAQSSILERNTSINLPPMYVVNSRAHVSRFKSEELSKQFKDPRCAISLPMEYDEAFEPEMNLLMSAGIGIYDITRMTDFQRRMVMAQYPQLMFLCSGKEIVFGTNLPSLTNIFIDGSFGDEEHRDVLYQLMGRAGRLGRSYHANIIVNSDKTLHKILNFKEDDLDEEVIKFNDSFDQN
jgi:hypothetical protein